MPFRPGPSKGGSRSVDCSDLVLGAEAGGFAALRDPNEFAKAYVHPEADTVAWPGDLDLDPDVLYPALTKERARPPRPYSGIGGRFG